MTSLYGSNKYCREEIIGVTVIRYSCQCRPINVISRKTRL